jgi:hypothetical protein
METRRPLREGEAAMTLQELIEPLDLAGMQTDLDALTEDLETLRAAGVSPYEIVRLRKRLAAAQAELNRLRDEVERSGVDAGVGCA